MVKGEIEYSIRSVSDCQVRGACLLGKCVSTCCGTLPAFRI